MCQCRSSACSQLPCCEDGGGGCIVGGILYREADGIWVMRHNYAVTARNTWYGAMQLDPHLDPTLTPP